jgi:hypothetical protein
MILSVNDNANCGNDEIVMKMKEDSTELKA